MLRTRKSEGHMLTLLEATRYLGLRGTSTIWRKLKAGTLAGVQDDKGEWAIGQADLDRYIAGQANTESVGMVGATALLGVNRKTVYRWASEGKLPGTQDHHGTWSFARSDLVLFKGNHIGANGRYVEREDKTKE